MKTIAIMQPYFLPYLGYFQLMQSVDEFVFLDDVNYQKNAWVNRNRILLNKKPHYITLPVAQASQNRAINQHYLALTQSHTDQILKTLAHAYQKSPYYSTYQRWCENLLTPSCENLAEFLVKGLRQLALQFNLSCKLHCISEIPELTAYRHQARLIRCAQYFEATHYLNLPGGKSLYQPEAFLKAGVGLSFLTPNLVPYAQGIASFVPSLSILDSLMFTGAIAR